MRKGLFVQCEKSRFFGEEMRHFLLIFFLIFFIFFHFSTNRFQLFQKYFREQDEVSYPSHKRAIHDASTDHGSCSSDRTGRFNSENTNKILVYFNNILKIFKNNSQRSV